MKEESVVMTEATNTTGNVSKVDSSVNANVTQNGGMDGDVLSDALVRQVEWYLGGQNLSTDGFLIQQMREDYYVPVAVLANFPKMKRMMTSNVSQIQLAEMIRNKSSLLEVDSSNTLVRPKFLLSEKRRAYLILREVPEITSIADVNELFHDSPNIVPESIRPDVGFTWFVTLSSPDQARAAYNHIEHKTIHGMPVKARVKIETLLRTVVSAAEALLGPQGHSMQHIPQHQAMNPNMHPMMAAQGMPQYGQFPPMNMNPYGFPGVQMPQGAPNMPGFRQAPSGAFYAPPNGPGSPFPVPVMAPSPGSPSGVAIPPPVLPGPASGAAAIPVIGLNPAVSTVGAQPAHTGSIPNGRAAPGPNQTNNAGNRNMGTASGNSRPSGNRSNVSGAQNSTLARGVSGDLSATISIESQGVQNVSISDRVSSTPSGEVGQGAKNEGVNGGVQFQGQSGGHYHRGSRVSGNGNGGQSHNVAHRTNSGGGKKKGNNNDQRRKDGSHRNQNAQKEVNILTQNFPPLRSAADAVAPAGETTESIQSRSTSKGKIEEVTETSESLAQAAAVQLKESPKKESDSTTLSSEGSAIDSENAKKTAASLDAGKSYAAILRASRKNTAEQLHSSVAVPAADSVKTKAAKNGDTKEKSSPSGNATRKDEKVANAVVEPLASASAPSDSVATDSVTESETTPAPEAPAVVSAEQQSSRPVSVWANKPKSVLEKPKVIPASPVLSTASVTATSSNGSGSFESAGNKKKHNNRSQGPRANEMNAEKSQQESNPKSPETVS
eukprot:CAMPEP_0182451480 /NCGR_PEP_ID=MMETSP1172-20130603/43743_1 /TAXON_ID=708627 /ORGANISM="Timspurckia oligopyrenoides, Strain CCMP3278" /LENGTH=777 /DNA_ID=CAMNT_0024649261 /DNA_START=309 /DNA_END=2642 /DNA_ORIENTATION=+